MISYIDGRPEPCATAEHSSAQGRTRINVGFNTRQHLRPMAKKRAIIYPNVHIQPNFIKLRASAENRQTIEQPGRNGILDGWPHRCTSPRLAAPPLWQLFPLDAKLCMRKEIVMYKRVMVSMRRTFARPEGERANDAKIKAAGHSLLLELASDQESRAPLA